MKIWMAIAVMMFAVAGHAGKAEAAFYSGSKVLGWCESDAEATQNACMFYLAGIVDITSAYNGWDMIKPDFCMPDGVSLNQLKRVALKGLNERP